MDFVETNLCLQAGKCIFNFLPFLFLREVHNETSVISLLILTATDTMITVFLTITWMTGMQSSPSIDVVHLRFLAFQNEAYQVICLLLPWVCFSEQWVRSQINLWPGHPQAQTSLSMQSRLLSLTCWLMAASYSQNLILPRSESGPLSETWDWKCPYAYINGVERFDWLLPSIGFVLGSTLFYNTAEHRSSISGTIMKMGHSGNERLLTFLLAVGTAVSFITLPAFLAVNSWAVVAMDKLCGLLRFQCPQPLSTVYSDLEQLKEKEDVGTFYGQHDGYTNKKMVV